jgi:hypothetical protein
MEIRDFTDTIRLGKYPFSLDVDPLGLSDWHGVIASFSVYPHSVGERVERAELRRKENIIGLFVFHWNDAELPKWWQDSELLWELKSVKGEGDGKPQE